MKKLLFLPLFLFLTTNFLIAQDKDGDTDDVNYKFFVGGQLGFQNVSPTDFTAEVNDINFSPYVAYQPNKNLIFGVSIGFINRKEESDNNSSGDVFITKDRAFTITPFARYRKAINDKMGLYAELGVPITSGSLSSEFGDNEFTSETSSYGVYLGPGIDYALSDRWVINAGWGAISYNSFSSDTNDNRINTFLFALNPNALNFSLNYLF